MQLFHEFSDLPLLPGPLAVTIGHFDGIHRGHQILFKRMQEVAPYSLAFTFSNPPEAFLKAMKTTHLIRLPHRLKLLEKMGIDFTLLVPFTESLAQQTAATFLTTLKKATDFSILILGEAARIGSDRLSDLHALGKILGFSVEYLPHLYEEGKRISSTAIRTAVQEGHLSLAKKLLGRPYSIWGEVIHGAGEGRHLRVPTANVAVGGLILPPYGVYVTQVLIEQQLFGAVANLGCAPTLYTQRAVYLEVHLLDVPPVSLYGTSIEVLFLEYLRPEQCFSSREELQAQIAKDCARARALLDSAAGSINR